MTAPAATAMDAHGPMNAPAASANGAVDVFSVSSGSTLITAIVLTM